MDRRYSISSGDGNKTSGRRRSSRLVRFAAWGLVIKERWLKTASGIGGLSEREATERRRKRSSLDCWLFKALAERPMYPLSAAALPPDMVTIGGRGGWEEVRGCSTIGPEVPLAPGYRRDSVGDG